MKGFQRWMTHVGLAVGLCYFVLSSTILIEGADAHIRRRSLGGSAPLCPQNNTKWYPDDPTPVGYIEKDFGQCIYSTAQYASFWIGWSSIICWIFAQFPQVYTNFKTGSADSLSWIFLVEWFIGDTCNLLGSILSHQLAPQIYTAVYFVMMDVVLCGQWAFYHFRNRKANAAAGRKTNGSLEAVVVNSTEQSPTIIAHDGSGNWRDSERAPLLRGSDSRSAAYATSAGLSVVCFTALVGHVMYTANASWNVGVDDGEVSGLNRLLTGEPISFAGRSLLQAVMPDDGCHTKLDVADAGYYIGWVSAAFYMGSRIPQIIRNYKRRSTSGLSPLLFIFAVLGNTTYGMGVFLYCVTGPFIVNHLPWILGSLGTLMFDFSILGQTYYYNRVKRAPYDKI